MSGIKLPTKKYKITFKPQNKTIEVDPTKIPYGDEGVAGSILDIALANGVEIEHACGGNLGCSTCHVIVESGIETCNSISVEEQDMVNNAGDVTPQSRLSCQCVPNGEKDLVVDIKG